MESENVAVKPGSVMRRRGQELGEPESFRWENRIAAKTGEERGPLARFRDVLKTG